MPHRSTPPRGEHGSAYIIALLALVVLSILGVGLSLVTQTEMQIGANERSYQRVFFTAEAALSDAAARRLHAQDEADYIGGDEGDCIEGTWVDPESPSGAQIDLDFAHTPPILLTYRHCNWCETGGEGQESSSRFYISLDGINAVAARVGGGRTLAYKKLSSMLELQPIQISLDALSAGAAVQSCTVGGIASGIEFRKEAS